MKCPSTPSTYRSGENILLNKNGILIYIMVYKNRIYSLWRVTARDRIMEFEFPLANHTYVIVKLIIYDYQYYILYTTLLSRYISIHKT